MALLDVDRRPLETRRLLVTIHEAASLLSLGRSTVYELIGKGELTPIHIGRSVRLCFDDLTHFIDRQRPIQHGTDVRGTPSLVRLGQHHPIATGTSLRR